MPNFLFEHFFWALFPKYMKLNKEFNWIPWNTFLDDKSVLLDIYILPVIPN